MRNTTKKKPEANKRSEKRKKIEKVPAHTCWEKSMFWEWLTEEDEEAFKHLKVKIILGLILSAFSASCFAMEAEKSVIPAQELAIYQECFQNKRATLAQLTGELGKSFLDENILQSRERKLKKALKQYAAQRDSIVMYGFVNACVASGAGYCLYNGCKTKELTALVGVAGGISSVFTLRSLYQFFTMQRPTHESVTKQLQQRLAGYDWRASLLRKILKIYEVENSKGA